MAVASFKLQHKEVTIPAASVATLRATPYTLVPAPDSGYMLEFLDAVIQLDYTAPAFTETADNLAIKYNNGSGVQVSQDIEMTGFITLTADSVTNAQPKPDAIVSKANCAGKALVLHNTGDGEFGGSGGSSLRVDITYRVVSVV